MMSRQKYAKFPGGKERATRKMMHLFVIYNTSRTWRSGRVMRG